MKKPFLLISFIFIICLLANAQETCKDVIYPAEGEDMIFECCIIEVNSSNVVYYLKDGDTLNTRAAAIIKDGRQINLTNFPTVEIEDAVPQEQPGSYKGHDLIYYERTMKRARSQQLAGIFATFFGAFCIATGIAIGSEFTSMKNHETIGAGILIAGDILMNVGIPLWISGAVKKNNNRKAIQEIEKQHSLTFGSTQNGIGMTFNF